MWIQFVTLCLSIALTGCATFFPQSNSDPESSNSTVAGWAVDRLLNQTCETGKGAKEIEGTIWLKTQSKEVHGQFYASVLATAPDQLKLEVTNFLGGTVALISVKKTHFEITKGPSEPVSNSGSDSWGGIPLRWATDLFLGKIPCPTLSSHLVLKKEEANQLTIEAPEDPLGAQKFSFKYRKGNDGLPWPESLHWERFSDPKERVEFKFDKPETVTLSPLQWEASSSEGAIKVRWKDRRRTPLP
jgi:hypothetical protein